MPYGKLWPGHPKPFSDELLTSWIVRVADSNAVKLQRMCWDLFGNGKSPWNRDVDRSAPRWLLKAMCEHTGVSYWDAYHSTLNVYRMKLFQQMRWAGVTQWITPINHYGMKQTSLSIGYCPACFAEDKVPYFRRHWRIALFCFCPEHMTMLHDHCPECNAPISYHRRDFGKELWDVRDIASCWSCGFDYRTSKQQPPEFYSDEIQKAYTDVLRSLLQPKTLSEGFDRGYFQVLHQMTRVMVANINRGKLTAYVCEQLGITPLNVKHGRDSIESRSQADRFHLVMLGIWMLADISSRLRDAWISKAIRYNLMSKDMHNAPRWYRELVGEFSDWRSVV